MRTWIACFVLAGCLTSEAHIGSPNVFVEGLAGEYPVHVIIRPPQVVPGLAEISVRVESGSVRRVTVLPVFAWAGREGAPTPDEAKPVRGETNLYSAALWLMKSGAYSVDVTIEGGKGKGRLVVPVNSVATNTRPMSRAYGLMLVSLGLLLFFGGLRIAAAIFGESQLQPGATPTQRDQWRGRLAVVLTAVVLSLLLLGGKKWWDFEDANYRNNALYRPLPVTAQVRIERDQPLLSIRVDTSERRGQWTPLIPDHGKIMHLFLVRDQEPGAFAHLHPVPRGKTEFQVPLPPLPGGTYHVYADVTHEDGFAETLTATVEIPPASLAMQRLWLGTASEAICSAEVSQRLASSLPFPPDPDDSWQLESTTTVSAVQKTPSPLPASSGVANVGGGYKMIWEHSGTARQNLGASLRFKLLTPDNQPALIEPYMGMLGHAVVRRQDGAVFAHIHPSGTFSMGAQEFFIEGKLPNHATSKAPVVQSSGVQPSPGAKLHTSHTNLIGSAREISFPYAFPQPGAYRIWVQTKTAGRILTGVFDTTVSAAK